MLTHHCQFGPETMTFLRRAHLQPQPRIAEGQILVRKGVRATIDISDGLVADLGHLCKASKVGAILEVDQVPIHPKVRAAFPQESLDFALTGGEDYELLFTASGEVIESVRTLADFPITVIGKITREGGVTLLDKEGKPFSLDKKGWEHLKQGD